MKQSIDVASQLRNAAQEDHPAGSLFSCGSFAQADMIHVDNLAGNLTDMCGTSARCIDFAE